MPPTLNEGMAWRILVAAIGECRCAELLECLFEGGSCTVDPAGHLVLIDAAAVRAMGRGPLGLGPNPGWLGAGHDGDDSAVADAGQLGDRSDGHAGFDGVDEDAVSEFEGG